MGPRFANSCRTACQNAALTPRISGKLYIGRLALTAACGSLLAIRSSCSTAIFAVKLSFSPWAFVSRCRCVPNIQQSGGARSVGHDESRAALPRSIDLTGRDTLRYGPVRDPVKDAVEYGVGD